ncbi:MAG: nucleotidyltransferase family protein [Clostridia bacterium]|nr:nucleotidyltransferase family protein [Clostridia bacterium]
MKVCGIVAEYNPLHSGHKFHINKSKELTGADTVVVVMSGSFTQRGEVASFDKWTRAKSAILAGANLVVELPFCFASAPAEIFAGGAIRLLENIGCDYVSFGSETGDIEKLKAMASAQEQQMEKHLAEGKSYSSAIAAASGTDFTPNDILAIEYLKAIDKYNLKITPFTVKREGGSYDSENTEDDYISAKACRRLIAEKDFDNLKKYMPAFEIYKSALEEGRYTNPDILGTLFAGLIRTGRVDLANAAYVTEGIENRIAKAAQEHGTLEGIVSAVKTKRYTHTRIMRIISCMMMGLTKDKLVDFVSTGARYIRVLAADVTGTKLMKEIKKNSHLEIITNLGNNGTDEMLSFDIAATNLQSLAMINKACRKANEDYTHFFERI